MRGLGAAVAVPHRGGAGLLRNSPIATCWRTWLESDRCMPAHRPPFRGGIQIRRSWLCPHWAAEYSAGSTPHLHGVLQPDPFDRTRPLHENSSRNQNDHSALHLN